MFPEVPGSVFRMFCSFKNDDGSNCSNEAAGEIGIILENNPRPGGDVMYLPICQEHLDKRSQM